MPINDHMARALEPRKVDARTKEVIAFAVAAINDCDYCINAHMMGLGRHGYDDEAIAEILATVALWSEVTRFNIGARVRWPEACAARRPGVRNPSPWEGHMSMGRSAPCDAFRIRRRGG